MQRGACELAIQLMKMAVKVMQYLDIDNVSTADDHISSYRSTMNSCFNLGFEVRGGRGKKKTRPFPYVYALVCLCLFVCLLLQYVREVFRLLGDDMAYRELGDQALDFTLLWIQQFVLPKCERGRGTRPR